MNNKRNIIFRRIGLSLAAFAVVATLFTIIANVVVERSTRDRIYDDIDALPHNRVALLLGTSPLNRYGTPNSYFTNRINTAVELFRQGKVDYIIVSGDNHTRQYDETTAMKDSLMAHGIPEDAIVPDYAGFRTLDSVVRAKKVFGCDSLTIISQADHNARALYLAEKSGIEAVAIAAPLRAGRLVRVRLALREWLARDKMMLDLLVGKRPHFLGEKIEIPQSPSNPYAPLKEKLTQYIADKNARIGIAVLVNGRYSVSVNGDDAFPMLSVYKFPIAMAVAEYCRMRDIDFSDSCLVTAGDLHRDTYSPMLQKYAEVDTASITFDELLTYALQQSDNNASDILLNRIGGATSANEYVSGIGIEGVTIKWSEDDMHIDMSRCYENSATPVAMAKLMWTFDFQCNDTLSKRIKQLMESCETGQGRLAKPLIEANAVIGHKTGTGFVNPDGSLMAVNDAGYVHLPDGTRYGIAVFIADSHYDMEYTENIIADISEMTAEFITDANQ